MVRSPYFEVRTVVVRRARGSVVMPLFIVVGLILLGMGAGYARLLDKQDRQDHENAVDVTTDTG